MDCVARYIGVNHEVLQPHALAAVRTAQMTNFRIFRREFCLGLDETKAEELEKSPLEKV